MFLLAIVIPLTIVLGAISALHFYWAAGGLWPASSERQLIDTVIGDPRASQMPPAWLSSLVGLALAGAAALPVIAMPYSWGLLNYSFNAIFGVMIAMLMAALVFIGRGIVGYLPFWRQRLSAQPFAKLDTRVYSPLCLVLGCAFLALDFLTAQVIATI
jgi:hypothetical protein